MDYARLKNSSKKDQDKAFIINYAPIFVKLSDSEKNLITQKSKVVEYNKGDIVYRRHQAPSAFYCVISGRVKIFMPSDSQANSEGRALESEVLEYLNCGKYFGMISCLLGENHSVSAEAVVESKILEISQEDFKAILHKIPRLSIALSQTLSRRLKKKDQAEKRIFESSLISILGLNSSRQAVMMFAANLALSVKKETNKEVLLINVVENLSYAYEDLGLPIQVQYGQESRVKVIKLDSLMPNEKNMPDFIFEDMSGVKILNVFYEIANLSYVSRFSALLALFSGVNHHIFISLPQSLGDVIFRMLNQSDYIYLLSDYDEASLKQTKSLLFELFEKISSAQDKIKLILNRHSNESGYSYDEAFGLLNCGIHASLPFLSDGYVSLNRSRRIVQEHPQIEYSKAIRRLARELAGVRVGLALGGGAAFGLAHIGVIKFLEKENIPIDMVVGTSMGSLVGALWASGINSSQLEEIFLEYNNNKRKTYGLLMDLYLHKMSIAKGNKIRHFLRKHIGDKTFQDVRLPFRVVACNLTRRKEVIFSSGRIIDAVMASIAIPGVFAPTISEGDLIIDGGILEPVPVGTLVKMGINKIIASNVLPSPEDMARSLEFNRRRQDEEKEKAYSGGLWNRLSYNIKSSFQKAFFPNVLDIIVNSMQMMEYAIAESDCQKADVMISPVAEGVDWFDFFKVEILIKEGEDEARKAFPLIKKVVGEKP